jgi:hypothetical protein
MLDEKGKPIKSIGKIHGSQKEAQKVFDADQLRRDNAARILSPEQINKKGKWRVSDVLKTTLGADQWSTPRPITAEDLKALKQNIKALGAKLGKGITANEAIKLSRPEDVKRATDEIHFAAPVYIRNGMIRFVTNASAESKDMRHFVNISLQDYAAIKGQVGTPLQLAKLAAQGNIKFECDCGRFNFWFRYIATRMGVNLGRDEEGYPKIRNPLLTGIACKHLLRVLVELNGSMQVHRKIATTLEHDRKQSNKKKSLTVKLTQAQADEITKKQDKNRRKIAVTEKEYKAVQQAMKEKPATAKPKKTAPASKTKPNPHLNDPYAPIRAMLKAQKMTDAEIEQKIAQMKSIAGM